jgi:hypothetical protein
LYFFFSAGQAKVKGRNIDKGTNEGSEGEGGEKSKQKRVGGTRKSNGRKEECGTG